MVWKKCFLIKIKDCAPYSFSILYKFIIPYNLYALWCELRKKKKFFGFYMFFCSSSEVGPYSHHHRTLVTLRLCVNIYVNFLVSLLAYLMGSSWCGIIFLEAIGFFFVTENKMKLLKNWISFQSLKIILI